LSGFTIIYGWMGFLWDQGTKAAHRFRCNFYDNSLLQTRLPPVIFMILVSRNFESDAFTPGSNNKLIV